MLTVPRTHLFGRVLQLFRDPYVSHRVSRSHIVSVPSWNGIRRHQFSLWYSVLAYGSETSTNFCNHNPTIPLNGLRPYQVVVAATRDMGIGKDGKLPWNLPSDLRYFKEVTTTTTVARKRNAVIMGRRTWESIPPKYQPLPGRLNFVLTRSESLQSDALGEDYVVCSDLPSALRLLAEPPHSLSIEKVFVIGGGKVLKEALNAPGCEVIYLTDIETNVECDTFVPRIDLSSFSLLHSSSKMVENNIQFSFLTYVRTVNIVDGTSASQSDSELENNGYEVKCLSEWLTEFDQLIHIQKMIASRTTVDLKQC